MPSRQAASLSTKITQHTKNIPFKEFCVILRSNDCGWCRGVLSRTGSQIAFCGALTKNNGLENIYIDIKKKKNVLVLYGRCLF